MAEHRERLALGPERAPVPGPPEVATIPYTVADLLAWADLELGRARLELPARFVLETHLSVTGFSHSTDPVWWGRAAELWHTDLVKVSPAPGEWFVAVREVIAGFGSPEGDPYRDEQRKRIGPGGNEVVATVQSLAYPMPALPDHQGEEPRGEVDDLAWEDLPGEPVVLQSQQDEASASWSGVLDVPLDDTFRHGVLVREYEWWDLDLPTAPGETGAAAVDRRLVYADAVEILSADPDAGPDLRRR